MRPVNCNCEMPYGVYLDWLSDMGWDTDELRMEEEFVGYDAWSLANYGCGAGYHSYMSRSEGYANGYGMSDHSAAGYLSLGEGTYGNAYETTEGKGCPYR